MHPDHPDADTLYVPEELARAHQAEARRTVAASHDPRRARRAAAARRRPPGPASAILQVHLAAAVLVLAVALLTGTWGIGLLLLGVVGLSTVLTLRLAAGLRADTSPAGTDRPSPGAR